MAISAPHAVSESTSRRVARERCGGPGAAWGKRSRPIGPDENSFRTREIYPALADGVKDAFVPQRPFRPLRRASTSRALLPRRVPREAAHVKDALACLQRIAPAATRGAKCDSFCPEQRKPLDPSRRDLRFLPTHREPLGNHVPRPKFARSRDPERPRPSGRDIGALGASRRTTSRTTPPDTFLRSWCLF
jgi:hypothetical protein